MSWRRLAPLVYSAAKVTASGATITLGSTVFSCYLALQIESASHRTLFKFFPHWYANVEQAYGIDPDLLASVRMAARNEKEDAARWALLQQQQQQYQGRASSEEVQEKAEGRTNTIFNIESRVGPARKQLQELSEISFVSDMSTCAMTA